MTKEEIQHLGALARITLSPEEVAQLNGEIEEILAYVGAVQEIAGDAAAEPALTPRYNVFREDVPTNAPGEYTDAILAEAPETRDGYVSVKKILTTEE